MVEHNALRARRHQRLRQGIREASARHDGVHMRREHKDALRRLRHATQLDDWRCKDDVHVEFFRGGVRKARELHDVVPI
ncbi:hypothetical protein SDC9_210637 [bioreactor metagenome]|uniref:Uncharacterized protein n=1 Tax=bioreactor metagenome TaxID=1076179 RepID=A0A645JRW8_9ZZZZ